MRRWRRSPAASRDFGDVQRALEALEAAFHARGYKVVTVQLPEQELGGGVVRLNVVEPKIGRIKVGGNTFYDEANVRRSMPALASGPHARTWTRCRPT